MRKEIYFILCMFMLLPLVLSGCSDNHDTSALLEMQDSDTINKAVIRMMQEQPFVDEENIFLMGTSQGGAVSAITAAANKEEIKGAILLYPAFVLVDNTKERFKSVEDIPDTYYLMWMTVGRAYAEKLLDYDIYEAISAYDKDVLLIHGDDGLSISRNSVAGAESEVASWVNSLNLITELQ